MGHFKCALGIVAALTIGFVFCGQASAYFQVGDKPFADTWVDDFDDGLLTGWARARHTEAGGEITMNGLGERSTTENYSALFAGETEWAYKLRVNVPSAGTYPGNRTATLWCGNDIRVQAYKTSSTTFQIWFGGNTYYSNGTFPYKSGNYNFDQYYEIGVHKADGLNAYDLYVDGAKIASGIASLVYDGSEVPTNGTISAESSIINFPGPYDYIYAGRAPIPGDANVDDLVDTQDFTILKANFGQDPATWLQANFNTDTLVDTQDFSIQKAHFGESRGAGAVPAPEPTALVLLAVGGLVPLLRRRRG